MAYPVMMVPVMIASPSDVAEDREAVRTALLRWNDIHSKDRGLAFAPVGWDTHISPEMGDRPQALINCRVLDDCDLLIAIFGTTLGSPSGESESGTVEEINRHVASSKPAMVYISDKPVSRRSIQSQQIQRLEEFERAMRTKGILGHFKSAENLIHQVMDHVSIALQKNDYLQKIRAAASKPEVMPAHPQGPIFSGPNPELSDDAKEIVRAAGEKPDGLVLKHTDLDGTQIFAGQREFSGTPRELARWESALEELVSLRLIRDKGVKGEIFTLTANGWKLSDAL